MGEGSLWMLMRLPFCLFLRYTNEVIMLYNGIDVDRTIDFF
jgi:hypothetical protein